MSEAVNNMKQDDSLSNPTVSPTDSLADNHTPEGDDPTRVSQIQPSNDEWQTVVFPDAISVDAIPEAVEASEPVTPGAADLPVAQVSPQVTQLQQENEVLRQQVSQLEEDIAQLQIELQLEVARFYCKEAEEAQERTDERVQALTGDLAKAQEQIQELSDKFERSQQTVNQKHSLVESLMQQLESSQQRIAQLERECALSQQRYNEQVQLVSQAENTCADLRMRLHRQQQQTLQFKAALEKSVEMNASVHAAYSEVEATVAPSEKEVTDPSFLPKAQPVKPWTNSTGKSIHRSLLVSRSQPAGLPNLFARLVKPSHAVEPEPEIADLAQPSPDIPETGNEALSDSPTAANASAESHVLDELFPAPAKDFGDLNQEQAPSEPIFDLGPFIEAGEVNVEQIASAQSDFIEVTVHQPTKEIVQPSAQESDLSSAGDNLWADLARLVEPDLSSEALEPEATVASKEVAAKPEQLIVQDAGQLEDSPEVSSSKNSSNAKSLSLASFPSRELEKESDHLSEQSQSKDPVLASYANPFPSFTLRPLKAEVQDAEATIAEPISESFVNVEEDLSIEADTSTRPNWPSPVLYPFRQPKKIPSMAAVDLPTFPR